MGTPHNEAAKGEIARVVLMPGDPLRARHIAQTYLQDIQPFNTIRGMLGFTGTYKGVPVSVMGSGMGIPSIGIYSYELFTTYDVDVIIRIGSCGAYAPERHVFDVVLADSAYSESTYALTMSGDENMIQFPAMDVNACILDQALALGIRVDPIRFHSSDVFYNGIEQPKADAIALGCQIIEMESFGLFHNANVCGKKAACLCTVSDSFVYEDEIATPQQREQNFDAMMRLALESAIAL